jgi:hypothetical protein
LQKILEDVEEKRKALNKFFKRLTFKEASSCTLYGKFAVTTIFHEVCQFLFIN